jgi:uncharacterized protein
MCSRIFSAAMVPPLTRDIQQAALDFPDLTSAVHHLALPYFEEVVYLPARFPNDVLVLSGTMRLPLIAPWEFNNYMRRLLRSGIRPPPLGFGSPAFGEPTAHDRMVLEHAFNRALAICKSRKRTNARSWANQARLFGVDIHRAKGRAQAMRPAG